MHRHHHRDSARLLSEEAPERHAQLRLHAPRDRRAVGVRGRGARHQPRPHRQGRLRVLQNVQGRRLQGEARCFVFARK